MRESPRSDGRGLRGKWKRTRITREGDQGRRRNLPPTGQDGHRDSMELSVSTMHAADMSEEEVDGLW